MLYQHKTFSCPAAPQGTTQQKWDLIFLTKSEFLAKYGVTSSQYKRLVAQ